MKETPHSEIRNPNSEFKVLDKGFVRLVDVMGGDDSVVNSARVSYGSGSKGEDKDKKLIEYLLRHQHMTPFEHAVFQFHVSCPIFVVRQWMRHRASCVTGDTELYFDLPSGPRKGKKKFFSMRVDDFHRKWHVGALPIPHAKRPSTSVTMPQKARLQKMLLRNLREDTWTFGHTHVVDVFKTGEKPVFEMTLDDGKKIRCTKEHRFRFEDGWKTLESASGLELIGDKAVYCAKLPRLAVNGRVVENPLYRDSAWLREQYSRPEANDSSIAALLGVSAIVIRKWRRIHGLTNLKPRGFEKGFVPWNKGRTYKHGRRQFSPEHLAAIRSARSGARSNFWKGGVASGRANIARWTTQVAPSVFERDGFRCRACQKIGGKFNAHHVIPVWADASKAYNKENLATLCGGCHRHIHGTNTELRFAAELMGAAAVQRYVPMTKPRSHIPPMMPKWVEIASIEYLGVRPTYDLSVEEPFHNYVANGIVTHNSYNEISARYTEVKDEFYVPDVFRAPDPKNKQSSTPSPQIDDKNCRELLIKSQQESYAAYQELLKAGVAREIARSVLPVGQYTQFYWTINARNLMHFIDLRADAAAQYEIQRYAEALGELFRDRMPWTWEAFVRFAWKGVNPALDAQKKRHEEAPAA